MQKQLTIVVTCTDRKSVQPMAALRIRNRREVGIDARAEAWTQSIAGAADRHPVRTLYQGETWSQVAALERAAETAGFAPHVLVASAGLGLVDAESSAPAYAATFSPGHPDSVGKSIHETQQWWHAINVPTATVEERLTAPTVFVLSKAYADAMAPALAAYADRPDVLIFGGSDAVAPALRIPSDRGLRKALGGTATSLNLRTARAWFERLPDPDLVGHRRYEAWDRWTREIREDEVYDRTPLTDDEVMGFVRELRASDPAVTRTRALRLLRDSGLACEQKRFALLFTTTLETA